MSDDVAQGIWSALQGIAAALDSIACALDDGHEWRWVAAQRNHVCESCMATKL